MHRNTYLLVIVLSICAALLIGINLGKKLTKPAGKEPLTGSVTPTLIPTPSILTYSDTYCGFSLNYPSNFTVLENASGSAILHNTADASQAITLTCQKNMSLPIRTTLNVKTFSIQTANGTSISAKLYTDSIASIDAVMFRHPVNGMDAFIAGIGNTFDAAIKTIKILP